MSVTPRILISALAALAVLPATASAAPHWSAPDIVFPADPASQAAPSILMDSAGRAIAVSSDARGPVIATGDATGHFGAPDVVAPGQAPADGVDGALGADGTLAVGWDVDGVVRVAVRKAGASSFDAPVDLTPANGGTPALAVGPDGTVTAAWREKSGAGKTKSYVIKVVTFGPSGGAGDAQTFDAGTSPVDSAIAAAAPDGTFAIAWRRAAPTYRVRVAVRAPGAATFGEPTLLDGGGQGLDTDVNLAFGSDNTLAAGWANQSGAFVALRPAGGAFGAPQNVSAGSGRGYGLGLAGGPGGVLSAGFDGGNALKVADGGASGFGAPADVTPIPQSQVITNVHLAYDAASGLEAAWLDPTDSSIHTADRPAGGAFTAQRVGFGDIGTGTVSLAAGPAGRATVLWRVRDGSVAAAVRSETADTTPGDPSSPAVTPPPARDLRAPVPTLRTKSVKLGKKKTITLRFRCNEACTLVSSGRILLAKGSAPLNPPRSGKPKTGTQKVTFKLGTSTLRQTRAILKRRKTATARIEISAADASLNTALRRFSVTIKR